MRFFTKDEDRFLRKNCLTIPAKRMAKMLGRTESTARQRMKLLGIRPPLEVIERFKKESQFKKGHLSFNAGRKREEFLTPAAIRKVRKTQFKKGNVPPNAKERDGVITVRIDHKSRNGKAYKYIRVSLGRWRQYHRYLWEKKRGKIKKGLVLIFIDGNSMNCKLSNLKLITRKQNMIRNSIQRYPKELITTIKLTHKLKRKINEKQAVRP